MDQTRRSALAGLTTAAVVGTSARAEPFVLPRAVQRHPGFKPWTQVYDPDPVPLKEKVITIEGEEAPLWAWLGRGPTVLVFWATWCAPCLSEKSAQSYMARRLKYLHAQTQIKLVQSWDDKSLTYARTRLDSLRATDLETARATPSMEKAFRDFFGAAPVDPSRPTLPALVLLGPGGVELGRAKGTMRTVAGQSYWLDALAMQFLAGLDKMLQQA